MIKIIKILLKHFFYRICNIYYVLIFKAKLVFKKKDSNNLSINSKNIDDYVNKLNENGYVVIKNFFDKEKLIKIDNELKNNPDKFYVYINGVKKKFSDNANYNQFLKKEANYAMYGSDPSLLFSLITKFKLFEKEKTFFLESLINKYLNYFARITSGNLRTSFSNLLKASETQLFHRDASGYKFLKAFIYLHDVSTKEGPFTFVKKSHKDKYKFKDDINIRYSDESISMLYGEDNIISLTAQMGDLILADTSGFHKGTKNINERTMITINFHAHYEVFRPQIINLEASIYKEMKNVWSSTSTKYFSSFQSLK